MHLSGLEFNKEKILLHFNGLQTAFREKYRDKKERKRHF